MPVKVAWGKHSMILALRALLRLALSDPSNSVFQLLCETSEPLHHPALVYREMLRSPISHVNTCPPPDGAAMIRANWRFQNAPELPNSTWRKSSQFLMLRRSDARLVLREERVERTLAKLCYDFKAKM